MKTLNVSESREIHLVLVQLELQTTETVTGTKKGLFPRIHMLSTLIQVGLSGVSANDLLQPNMFELSSSLTIQITHIFF